MSVAPSEAPPPRRHVHPIDATDFRWYFSTGRRQLDGASNFGAMLDRLSMFGQHARPCKACGGKRGTWDDEGNTIEAEEPGSGFVWSSEEMARKRELKRLGLLTSINLPGDLTCPKCKGRGWVTGSRRGGTRGPTMKVSTAQTSGPPETGGSGSLARLGHVSRIVDSVRKRSMRAFLAMETWYSPGGESEACLWHLTPAGKTMLRRNNLGLPERQFFANERNRQKENPNTERELLFRAADNQAAELHDHMVAVIIEVVG